MAHIIMLTRIFYRVNQTPSLPVNDLEDYLLILPGDPRHVAGAWYGLRMRAAAVRYPWLGAKVCDYRIVRR